jgi:hypothetical protein
LISLTHSSSVGRLNWAFLAAAEGLGAYVTVEKTMLHPAHSYDEMSSLFAFACVLFFLSRYLFVYRYLWSRTKIYDNRIEQQTFLTYQVVNLKAKMDVSYTNGSRWSKKLPSGAAALWRRSNKRNCLSDEWVAVLRQGSQSVYLFPLSFRPEVQTDKLPSVIQEIWKAYDDAGETQEGTSAANALPEPIDKTLVSMIRIGWIIGFAILVYIYLFVLTNYRAMPAIMALHFTDNGLPMRYSPKWHIWKVLQPCLIVYIVANLFFRARAIIPKYRDDPEIRIIEAITAWAISWVICCFAYSVHGAVEVALGRAVHINGEFYFVPAMSVGVSISILYFAARRAIHKWL